VFKSPGFLFGVQPQQSPSQFSNEIGEFFIIMYRRDRDPIQVVLEGDFITTLLLFDIVLTVTALVYPHGCTSCCPSESLLITAY